MRWWSALIMAGVAAGCGKRGVAEETGDTGAMHPSADGWAVEVFAHEPRRCASPERREEAKFDLIELRQERDKKAWFWGGGAIVFDLDGDGWPELLLPGFWETHFYRGGPDGWVDASHEVAHLPLRAGSGGSVADIDGDGDLDVIVTRYLLPNVLLRNDEGVLVDVSVEAGMPRQGRRSIATSWGDIDGDGDLDLFIGNYGIIDESREDPTHANFLPADPSWLLLNDGAGRFTDASDRLPQLAHDGYTFSGGFIDIDDDGLLDLYIVNDFGNSFPNVYLRNTGGQFSLDADQRGLDVAITGMGLGIGDVNADGVLDFAMTAWNGNSFLWSSPFGWIDHAAATGLVNDLSRGQKVAWGIELVDVDNDGDLDAPMAYGYLDTTYEASVRQPDAIYLQTATGRFEDVGQAWGFNQPTIGRGFVATDLDGDGWLDFVKRDLAGPTLLYRARCGAESWVKVRLKDPTSPNRDAIGAKVRVIAGELVQERRIVSGTVNHASGGPLEAHFGLGSEPRIDALEIVWPDGERSVVRGLEGFRTFEITRQSASSP